MVELCCKWKQKERLTFVKDNEAMAFASVFA